MLWNIIARDLARFEMQNLPHNALFLWIIAFGGSVMMQDFKRGACSTSFMCWASRHLCMFASWMLDASTNLVR